MVKRASTIPELLIDDMVRWMHSAADGVARRVLVWLDPKGDFKRLIQYLETPLADRELNLLGYARDDTFSQLKVKVDLLELESGNSSAIVYLEGFDRADLQTSEDGSPPLLWSVYDYRYKGSIWGRGQSWVPGSLPEPFTLARWLQGHGSSFLDDAARKKLTAGGGDSQLARYVERNRDQVPTDWQQPLRETDVVATLTGDPRDAMRLLLAAPSNVARIWGDEMSLIVARIESEYGFKSPHIGATSEELADEFALRMAMTDAFVSLGSPDDFPYRQKATEQLQQQRRVLALLHDDVLPHSGLLPSYRERLLRLEKSHDLSVYARDHAVRPNALPRLADSQWRSFLASFAEAEARHWQAALTFASGQKEAIEVGANTPWDGLNRDTQWFVVRDLLALANAAAIAKPEIENTLAASSLARFYAEEWWRIDMAYLRIRAVAASESGIEGMRRVVDMVYFDFVSKLNDQFTRLVEAADVWPPPSMTMVDSLRDNLWAIPSGRSAVVIVDALRWDLARQVVERLGEQAQIQPVVTTLPSTTPFGMTALLPLQDNLSFGFNPAAVVRAEDGDDLAQRQKRKDYLQSTLGNNKRDSIAFVDFWEVAEGRPPPQVTQLVVFDNSIDEQGHKPKGSDQFLLLVEEFVDQLTRVIERLHMAGIGTVHVVTDHGFLFLPTEAVDSLGQPELPANQVLKKDHRWAALKPGVAPAQLIRFSAPLSNGTVPLGFPRGVRVLKKSEPFLHGGISLHECLIPYLVSRVGLSKTKVRPQVTVTTPELTGGTVPIVVTIEGGQQVLDSEPITVRIWVTSGSPSDQKVAAEPIELEVRPDIEVIRPALYLKEELGLRAGSELTLHAIDNETEEQLAIVRLTLKVDWD
jgi:hypothetical protein